MGLEDIKFKAKRLDNNQWVEGDLVKLPKNQVGICYLDNLGDVEINVTLKVDPSTVCQYTGLIDENGVELYEGDYIKILDEERLIEYNPVACGFILQETPARTMRSLDVLASYAFEVIGNKFDKEESK